MCPTGGSTSPYVIKGFWIGHIFSLLTVYISLSCRTEQVNKARLHS